MRKSNGKVALLVTVLLPELGPPKLVGVNALEPGAVETNGVRAGALDEGALGEQQENTTPTGRIDQPSDIVAAAASLLPGPRYQPLFRAIQAGAIAEPLSGRECDIVHLIAQGYVNKEIARMLSISPETVKSHVKKIFIKLSVQKRAQAVWRAQSLGLIHTP